MLGSAAPALAQNEYEVLRSRWIDTILGTGYSSSEEPYASRLAELGMLADQYRSTMTPGATNLWPDLPIGSVSANVGTSLYRLRTMAKAWAQPGTGWTGDAGLAADTITGLDWMVANAYTSSGSEYDNWWHWRIGSPQALLDTATLLYDELSAGQRTAYGAAVDNYVPDSQVGSYSGVSTGANRVDLCRVLAIRGLLGEDSGKVALASDALSPTFPYVTSGDGLYVDGSYIQHTRIPYTGSYGAVFIAGLARLFALLAGSSWEVTDPNRQIIFDAVENAYAPFLFNGLVMDGVSGRAISRGVQQSSPAGIQQDDHVRGHNIVASILLLAEAASTAERHRWRGLAKGWFERAYWCPPEENPALSVPGLARAMEVLDDPSVAPIAEPVAHRVFGSMDRATHRRPGWALAVSMCSVRTPFYTHGNGENLRGWHTNSGMTYWWGDDFGNGQYSDAFWPTVDPYRLPGTTVSRKPLADGAGPVWSGTTPPNTWAGGATDGEFGAVGQYVHGLESGVEGKKSWFCLDDAVVCLGTIRGDDGYVVETTVDNRNLSGSYHGQALIVDGAAQPTDLGWSATLTDATWAHLYGFGGYVFPGGADVHAVREARTGSWNDINVGGTTDPITRNYLTMWFDHGVDPYDDTYAYLLMPGAGVAETEARGNDTAWLAIHNNTWWQHAIVVPSLGVTAMNLWHVPLNPIAGVMVDEPASVLIRESGASATIAVADPKQNVDEITVTWDRPVSGVTNADPSVTVLETGTRLVIQVTVGGSAGASHLAEVVLA